MPCLWPSWTVQESLADRKPLSSTKVQERHRSFRKENVKHVHCDSGKGCTRESDSEAMRLLRCKGTSDKWVRINYCRYTNAGKEHKYHNAEGYPPGTVVLEKCHPI